MGVNILGVENRPTTSQAFSFLTTTTKSYSTAYNPQYSIIVNSAESSTGLSSSQELKTDLTTKATQETSSSATSNKDNLIYIVLIAGVGFLLSKFLFNKKN